MEATIEPPCRRRKQRKDIKGRGTTTTILELPSHITSDILSRLPLKSIFNCKRACSSFRNLTLDPYFAQLQLPRSSLCLILYRTSDIGFPMKFGFLPLQDSLVDLRRRRATMKFETQIEIPGRNLCLVSCNGLICLSDHFCPSNVYCSIYTLGVDDEWRTLGPGVAGLPFPRNSYFVFLNGAFHWIGRENTMLFYLDMEKEQCGNLPLPSQFSGYEFHLGVVDNCLYICDEKTSSVAVNIWVLKDYGNLGSWTLEWIIQRPLPPGLNWDLKPVKTFEDGTSSTQGNGELWSWLKSWSGKQWLLKGIRDFEYIKVS
ncbi:hypothetical protein Vadar_011632 [Vaccinium darrowii]|nr:hypothetical protein Vadar_011632 [Vaccinium darrowii]